MQLPVRDAYREMNVGFVGEDVKARDPVVEEEAARTR